VRTPGELLRAAAERRLAALRNLALPVGQAAVASALAWYVAHDLIGHPKAFFAPIAATIAIGLAAQQYLRRVLELTLGVALGVLVADALVSGIGSGVWQIGLVVGLAMAAAVLIGGGPLFVSQAAGSSVLVVTLPASPGGTRFVDALVGGAIGIGIVVLSPTNPVRRVRCAADEFLVGLASAIDAVADALERRDIAAARAALGEARATEDTLRRWLETLRMGRETAALSPPYWRVRARLDEDAAAAGQLEMVVRNVRVLARASIRASELDPSVPPELPAAIRTLADAVRAARIAFDRPDRSEAIGAGLRAVELASRAYELDEGLPVATVVGLLRSATTDLLVALGVERPLAIERVRAAAGVTTA